MDYEFNVDDFMWANDNTTETQPVERQTETQQATTAPQMRQARVAAAAGPAAPYSRYIESFLKTPKRGREAPNATAPASQPAVVVVAPVSVVAPLGDDAYELDDEMLGAEPVAEAWQPPSGSLMRRATNRSAPWSEEESRRFVDCLQQFGTDFSIMAYMFPGRTRVDMKRKFDKMQKSNPDSLSSLLAQRKVTFPREEFDQWKKKCLDFKK